MTPRNEMEVITLFCQQAQAAGFEIISMQTNFPDAIIRHGEVEYKAEFEFKASNFWAHKHNPTQCDLIICWINDDEYPVLPIIALSSPDWPNTPIDPPPTQERLVGYWRARALLAENKPEGTERKVKGRVRGAKGLTDLSTPEETKAELDALLEEAVERARGFHNPPKIDKHQLIFIFGELLEDLFSKKAGIELLHTQRYGRQLVRLMLS
jgi:hypothetical protein